MSDVAGTTYTFSNGEVGQQINNNSNLLQNNLHSGNQGIITTNDQNVNVNAYVTESGQSIITLTKDDNPDYERVLWENGEFNPTGQSSFIPIGREEELQNEIKGIYIDYSRQAVKGKDQFIYPEFLNIPNLDVNSNFEPEEEKEPEQQATFSTNTDLEFGKLDKIIKKLSLRNLVYPLDADFGNTQDYMQINQFKYRPPNQDLFFPQSLEGLSSDEVKDKAMTNFGQIATQGVPLGTPREEFLGLVKLPMPNSLADSNNVSWGADQLNALTAAVSSGVFGQVENVSNLIRKAVQGGADPVLGNQMLGNVLQTLGDGYNLVREAVGDAKTETGTVLNALKDSNSNISVLGSAVAGSALLNILQFGVTPETILARGQGVVPNNNLALLFNSPTLREFTFTWKMTPRSREEAIRVNNIIRFFKQGMAPKKGINSQTGAASYFLGTPNVFDIVFKTTRDQYGILNENNSVVRIKTCACTGTAVNYTPDGMWNAYEKGQPVSVTMSLRFSELEPIFDTDYDENLFNYDENRPDLRPVPIDAVGY